MKELSLLMAPKLKLMPIAILSFGARQLKSIMKSLKLKQLNYMMN